VCQKPSLVQNPLEWLYRAHLPYSRALLEVGRIDDALVSCEKGLKYEPHCPFLLEHKRMIAEQKKEAA
ncbi:MAG: hypothetical protein ACRD2L_17610, partial [Terriglobia bacterium]